MVRKARTHIWRAAGLNPPVSSRSRAGGKVQAGSVSGKDGGVMLCLQNGGVLRQGVVVGAADKAGCPHGGGILLVVRVDVAEAFGGFDDGELLSGGFHASPVDGHGARVLVAGDVRSGEEGDSGCGEGDADGGNSRRKQHRRAARPMTHVNNVTNVTGEIINTYDACCRYAL